MKIITQKVDGYGKGGGPNYAPVNQVKKPKGTFCITCGIDKKEARKVSGCSSYTRRHKWNYSKFEKRKRKNY